MIVTNLLGKKHIQLIKEKDMGKGSSRRKEDKQKVNDNWDLIFGKKDKTEEKPAKTEDSTKTK